MAYGLEKPVVATAVDGLRDVIEDGRTGYLVPPGEPAALADAIVRFFENDKEKEFSENIRQYKQRFAWQRLVEIIEAVVEPPIREEAEISGAL
jgi:glycosyltransferase involved in cell wall biosynthesis